MLGDPYQLKILTTIITSLDISIGNAIKNDPNRVFYLAKLSIEEEKILNMLEPDKKCLVDKVM